MPSLKQKRNIPITNVVFTLQMWHKGSNLSNNNNNYLMRHRTGKHAFTQELQSQKVFLKSHV